MFLRVLGIFLLGFLIVAASYGVYTFVTPKEKVRILVSVSQNSKDPSQIVLILENLTDFTKKNGWPTSQYLLKNNGKPSSVSISSEFSKEKNIWNGLSVTQKVQIMGQHKSIEFILISPEHPLGE